MQDNKIERYLIDMMVTFQEVDSNTWIIEDEEHHLPEVIVMRVDTLVVLRVPLMDAPKERRVDFFAKLLSLNASDLLHGAYALEGEPGSEKVLLLDTLEYETMDFPEFRATLDAFSIALTQHYPVLQSYRF